MKALKNSAAFCVGCLAGVGSSALSFPVSAAAASVASGDDHDKGAEPGREAMFYTVLDRNRVRCDLCNRNCLITNGGRGFCRNRENREGRLYSLVYGRAAGLQIDPVEMEPMHHMLPGHRNLCVFTASCNFRCLHCQNWHISQKSPEEISARNLSPSEIVRIAKNRDCKSISHSINEPTVFYEYMLDIGAHARRNGLLTLFHTNGYIASKPLRTILKHMDGVTVDLKAFNEEFYRDISSASLEPVLNTLRIIKEEDKHMEIVNLVIPTLNDNSSDIRKMCAWIRENLGDDVPLHFNRFAPKYKLTDLPFTPVKTLETAAHIAHGAGLKYVYIGNVPGHRRNSTYCPGCEKLLIHRTHFSVLSVNMTRGSCNYCGYHIQGIWEGP